jgi:hypothetical protein
VYVRGLRERHRELRSVRSSLYLERERLLLALHLRQRVELVLLSARGEVRTSVR